MDVQAEMGGIAEAGINEDVRGKMSEEARKTMQQLVKKN